MPLPPLLFKRPSLLIMTLASAKSAVLPSRVPVLATLTLLESSRILMPNSAPLILPALFISPPILATVIPLAPVELMSAFSWFVTTICWDPVEMSIPSPLPVICPPFVTLTMMPSVIVTEGKMESGVMLIPSGMMYEVSDEKTCTASVEPLIVVSANPISGVNAINADKAGKRLLRNVVV
ncbi:hypothetical protein PAS25_24460 [Leclercia adecarboxylata]|uniref:hypothetical protein n=1 Tax=Leclercia TaxID=83654 RepID=UPI001E2924C3|nr:hypothetical protein [Leclercia adecarboxylata]